MRRMLAGFLATSMIVAVASATTFAATSPSISFRVATAGGGVLPSVQYTTAGAPNTITASKNILKSTATIKSVDIALGGGTMSIPVGESITKNITVTVSGGALNYQGPDDTTATTAFTALSRSDILTLIDGTKFSSIELDGKIYSGTIVKSGTDTLIVNLDGAQLSSSAAVVAINYDVQCDYSGLEVNTSAPAVLPIERITTSFVGAPVVAGSESVTPGNGKDLSQVEKTGAYFSTLGIKEVIWCDGNGVPVPMTEKDVGVDKDLNGQGGVQSGKTLYFMVNDTTEQTFADDTYWKLKITKGDNGKLIKQITDTTKIFSSPLVDANSGAAISGIDFTKRHRYIKVEMNEIFTDDEYKITLDLRMSPTSKAETKFAAQGVDGSEIKIKDFSFWMKNIVKPADNDWKVGIGGLMLNPLQNDWNEVTYYDEDGDLAFMKFFADSDVSKFYAKLSTKWEHADYASYFNDQDAYIFDFVGSPKISATSRCDLQIYNPFVNEDGDETIDPASATIYQVIDGDLFDVTDNFTYEEGDNGDMAFCTRTRFLGTYIICEKPVEEAVDGDAPDTDLVPEDTTPVEVIPGNDDGGKAPANTGKYL